MSLSSQVETFEQFKWWTHGEAGQLNHSPFLSCPSCPSSGQEKSDQWCPTIRSDKVLASEMSDNDIWRPVIGPGEVTVTDITLNSLTVTFRESTMAKDFFSEWGLGLRL